MAMCDLGLDQAIALVVVIVEVVLLSLFRLVCQE